MSLFKTIVGAVAGPLVGGLLNKNKSTTSTSRINYQQLRDDAKAAGFNPLTALKATGGAGNTSVTNPSLSNWSFISDAISGGFDSWFNREQRELDRQARQLQVDAMREELKILQDGNRRGVPRRGFGYGIPSVVDAVTGVSVRENPRLARGKAPSPAVGERDLSAHGARWLVDETTSSAEDVEAEYGDFGSSLYGLGKMAFDFGRNAKAWAGFGDRVHWDNKKMRDLYYKQYDLDRDGNVTRREKSRVKAIEMYDKNGDGKVTRDERRQDAESIRRRMGY